MSVFVDSGYRTRLGVSFYDRRRELELLESHVDGYRVVIVYGPRNVGKSELVYYWSRRRARRRVIAFQVDLMRASGSVEGLARYLAAPEDRVRETLLSVLRGVGLEHLRLLDLVLLVYDAVRVLGRDVVLFLDEFHMLPGYEAAGRPDSYATVLADLEALAHRLAKEEDGPRVVLTVSEGFVAVGDVFSRLHGYNTSFMLVEQLDEKHFAALYNEYREARGCGVSLHLVYGVVGGAPGYLTGLCRGRHALLEFVEYSKTVLENSLSSVRSKLSLEPWKSIVGPLEPQQLISMAYTVASGIAVSPLEQPVLYGIGQLLAIHNIVYPVYEASHVRFKPQIPLYQILLGIAVEENKTSILGIKASKALEKIEKEYNHSG